MTIRPDLSIQKLQSLIGILVQWYVPIRRAMPFQFLKDVIEMSYVAPLQQSSAIRECESKRYF